MTAETAPWFGVSRNLRESCYCVELSDGSGSCCLSDGSFELLAWGPAVLAVARLFSRLAEGRRLDWIAHRSPRLTPALAPAGRVAGDFHPRGLRVPSKTLTDLARSINMIVAGWPLARWL